jgi:thiol:disulfide interchange protein DsbA
MSLHLISPALPRLLLAAALFLAGFAAHADFIAGKDYELVSPPQAVETGKKIEVLEIFSYGCPHCFDLEADFSLWARQQPKDVEVRRLPAIFRDSWIPLAKAYFAFDAMGLTDRLHGDFFNAIHVKKMHFDDDNAVFDWVEKQGVNRKTFADTYSSFAIQTKAMRAKQMSKAYGITGVPAVIVDGKYRAYVSAKGHAGLFATVDQLVRQARQERAGK